MHGRVAASASTIIRRAATPYGTPLTGRAPGQTTALSSGDPYDATAPGHIGARNYNPATDLFISVDPNSITSSPQTMTGYTYAADSPVTNSDPTGLVCVPGEPVADCNDTSTQNNTGTTTTGTSSTSTGAGGESSWTDDGSGGSSGGFYVTSMCMRFGLDCMFHHPPVVRNPPGGTGGFLAGLGYAIVSLAGLACGACIAAHIFFGTPDVESDYLQWVKHLGVNTNPNTEFANGFAVGNLVLLLAGGVAGGADAVGVGVDVAADGADAGEAGADAGEQAAASCGGSSFTAQTKIVLASGDLIQINRIKVGDKVLATDVETGKTRAERVVTVLVHHDTDLYDLRARAAHGLAVIHTTSSHLFWDLTAHRWVKAGQLGTGDSLRGPVGLTAVTVSGGYTPSRHNGWMWDLTVQDDHDFYVEPAVALPPSQAGPAAVAILVHNCGDGTPDYSTRTERAGDLPGKYTQGQSTRDPASQWYHEMLSNTDLIGSINDADEGEGIIVSQEGRIIGGNHRMDELLMRIDNGQIDPETPIMIQLFGDR